MRGAWVRFWELVAEHGEIVLLIGLAVVLVVAWVIGWWVQRTK